ncbi:MAG: hypothetical protein KDF58_06245 [Alphaproteobacteria bacterium]|nr:hypothetical protein [Alphaproteobacteria bacterium]
MTRGGACPSLNLLRRQINKTGLVPDKALISPENGAALSALHGNATSITGSKIKMTRGGAAR